MNYRLWYILTLSLCIDTGLYGTEINAKPKQTKKHNTIELKSIFNKAAGSLALAGSTAFGIVGLSSLVALCNHLKSLKLVYNVKGEPYMVTKRRTSNVHVKNNKWLLARVAISSLCASYLCAYYGFKKLKQ